MIVDNRRARHDYHLSDRVEAGLVLAGTEVKALRDGKATLQQAYADVREGEAWLIGLHIPEYGAGNRANHEPDRPRKLLMHRREIDRLYAQVREKGFTLIPTRLYFKDGRVKAEIAVARGKGIPLADGLFDEIMAAMKALPPNAKSSMLQDLERGRRLELPWLSSAIVRIGHEVSVDTPVHRFIAAVLKPHERGDTI